MKLCITIAAVFSSSMAVSTADDSCCAVRLVQVVPPVAGQAKPKLAPVATGILFTTKQTTDTYLATAFHHAHNAELNVSFDDNDMLVTSLQRIVEEECFCRPELDLIVFKCTSTGLDQLRERGKKPMTIRSENVMPGLSVTSYGNPTIRVFKGTKLAHESRQKDYFASGSLSAVDTVLRLLGPRAARPKAHETPLFLITKSDVMPGFSGGPVLFNGEVIGMVLGGDPSNLDHCWALPSAKIVEVVSSQKENLLPAKSAILMKMEIDVGAMNSSYSEISLDLLTDATETTELGEIPLLGSKHKLGTKCVSSVARLDSTGILDVEVECRVKLDQTAANMIAVGLRSTDQKSDEYNQAIGLLAVIHLFGDCEIKTGVLAFDKRGNIIWTSRREHPVYIASKTLSYNLEQSSVMKSSAGWVEKVPLDVINRIDRIFVVHWTNTSEESEFNPILGKLFETLEKPNRNNPNRREYPEYIKKRPYLVIHNESLREYLDSDK